jgi:hypothetical protein
VVAIGFAAAATRLFRTIGRTTNQLTRTPPASGQRLRDDRPTRTNCRSAPIGWSSPCATPSRRPRDLATAEFTTIRLRLLKIAARVTETAGRVRLAFAGLSGGGSIPSPRQSSDPARAMTHGAGAPVSHRALDAALDGLMMQSQLPDRPAIPAPGSIPGFSQRNRKGRRSERGARAPPSRPLPLTTALFPTQQLPEVLRQCNRLPEKDRVKASCIGGGRQHEAHDCLGCRDGHGCLCRRGVGGRC